MSWILTVNNLQKTFKSEDWPPAFKDKEVLKSLSFKIRSHSITGFLGANGSGKTTTLKGIMGLMPFDEGEVSFFGEEALSPKVLKKIGFLPETPSFYNYLTGEELLLFYGSLSGSFKKAELTSRARALLKKLNLYDSKDQKIKTYSKGMLQKAGLAQALIHEPEFVILDEPMAGLDPDSRFNVSELLEGLKNKGVSVFFSSHLLYDVERLCSDLVVVKNGKTAYEGSVQELLDKMPGHKKEIVYTRQGKKHSVFVNTLEECQKEIDHLRKQNCEIVNISAVKMHLEQAFKEISTQ